MGGSHCAKIRAVSCMAVLCSIGTSGQAIAADGAKAEQTSVAPGDGGAWSMVYSNLFVGRLNPLGMKDDFKLMLKKSIMRSDHLMLRDSHLAMGLVTSFKPTATQIGFGIDLQPVAVLKLSGSVEWVTHLEPFDNLLSFPGPGSDHSDKDREKLGQDGENYATQGVYISLGALLQMKIEQLAVRSDLKLVYADLALRRNDTVFYEIEWDLLAMDRGWLLLENADVLYMANFGLVAGARYSLAHALYAKRAFPEGESTVNPNTPVHRLGVVLGWSFKDVDPRFCKPTILLVTSWYLAHRYRTGQDVSQGMPCIILAFAFNGTLL